MILLEKEKRQNLVVVEFEEEESLRDERRKIKESVPID